MPTIFDKVQVSTPGANWFDLSFDHKTTFNMGELIPFHVQEVIPGDFFKINTKNLLRFAPMTSPVMERIKVYTNYFFVPNRIIYNKWEGFITGGQDPSAAPTLPYIGGVFINPNASSLAAYMGLPIGTQLSIDAGTPISLLPFAAYQRIWFDWFRDQNFQDMEWPELVEGPNTADISFWLGKKRRSWRRDYFTSALPWAQRGDAVTIPVIGNITGDGEVYLNSGTQSMAVTGTPPVGNPFHLVQNGGSDFAIQPDPVNPALTIPVSLDPNGRLSVDGEDFTMSDVSTTINDLRTSYSLQRLLEKFARSGSRYKETLIAFFGVAPRDERLQRAEFIGSNIQNVIISEVLQQSETNTTPQGNMAGHGISASRDGYFTYSVKEHGYIIGIVSVLPETSYSQGVPRHFTRGSRYEYYWPEFANIGEQAVLNREVFARSRAGDPAGAKLQNEETWGYMPRYAEYRFNNNMVSGQFAKGQPYDYWNLARQFDSLPLLNESFIVSDPSLRIFADQSGDDHKILAHIFSDIKARRKMPKYGTPTW